MAKLLLIFYCLITVSFVWAENCENGECADELISELNALHKHLDKSCYSNSKDISAIKRTFEKNGVSEYCWKLLTRVTHLEKQLLEIQSNLETQLTCENNINDQIEELEKTKQKLECNHQKKSEVRSNCNNDLKCALVSGALSLGGYVAEVITPEAYQISNCHYGNDGCLNQIASSFLKSVMLFFKGCWAILKSAGGYTYSKLGDFWNWVTDAEDHSSTYQLGLAKASEDESFFQNLITDFPGTISKLWSGLIHAIQDWLKTDVFCSKWSGAAHLSKCLDPTENIDCVSCKAILNGICSISGYVVAEIVPAFITGGLVTIAKHGTNGASKISRLFKTTPEISQAMKSTELSRFSKINQSLAEKISSIKLLNQTKLIIESSLVAIRTYLVSPARDLSKKSYETLSSLITTSKVYLYESKTEKILVFGEKTLKTSAKAILYPIDNPMVTLAYKEGQRSFDKLLRLGAPKLADKTTIINHLITKDVAIESIIASLRNEQLKTAPSISKIYNLEAELLERVGPLRKKILKETFQAQDLNFNDLIEHLYPELKYGELSRFLPQEKILKAEQELYEQILFLPEGDRRSKLLQSFETYVTDNKARGEFVNEPFIKPERVEFVEGSIVTEGEVEQSLSLTRPILKSAAPAYNQSSEDQKKEKENKGKKNLRKIKKALKEGPDN